MVALIAIGSINIGMDDVNKGSGREMGWG